MIRLSKSAGFSLVELMIVVAIMAILAAIAIPSFLRFSMRAKTAEATSNLAAIRTAQESYRAEEDTYLECPAAGGAFGNPAAWAVGAGASTPIAWDAGTNFETIGFEPDGNVRYQYRVAAAGAGISVAFLAECQGDLDEDGAAATFTVSKAALTYPKAIKGGDDF